MMVLVVPVSGCRAPRGRIETNHAYSGNTM